MPHTSNRPDCERAYAFVTNICTDPGCGLHITALRRDDKPICEMIIGRQALHELLKVIHELGLDL